MQFNCRYYELRNDKKKDTFIYSTSTCETDIPAMTARIIYKKKFQEMFKQLATQVPFTTRISIRYEIKLNIEYTDFALDNLYP